jgi:RNA polymerase sigma factor FliA
MENRMVEQGAVHAVKSVSKDGGGSAITRRDAYVLKHHALVGKVAKRLARRLPSHVSIDDLISAGMLGLLEAADRFDPARGQKFESFAEFRIRGAMLDDLRLRDSLSRDMRRLCRELQDATHRLTQQLGRHPTESDVASFLGVSVSEVRNRESKLSGASLIGFEDADPWFFEHTADKSIPDPYEETARREFFDHLSGHIRVLPDRMQQVLALYYCENLDLKEIGVVIGVTESRICQIHREATLRLRKALGEQASHEHFSAAA